MRNEIYVSREVKGLGFRNAAALIKKAVNMALDAEKIDAPCIVSVLLTDDEGIRAFTLQVGNKLPADIFPVLGASTSTYQVDDMPTIEVCIATEKENQWGIIAFQEPLRIFRAIHGISLDTLLLNILILLLCQLQRIIAMVKHLLQLRRSFRNEVIDVFTMFKDACSRPCLFVETLGCNKAYVRQIGQRNGADDFLC